MTHHGYSPEQTRAILKALYHDGFAPRHVADLLCTDVERIMNVVQFEDRCQKQAKALEEKPLMEWEVKDPAHKYPSMFGLRGMYLNEKKEMEFSDMEAAIKYRKRLTDQVKNIRKRQGHKFKWQLVGRTLKYERIE